MRNLCFIFDLPEVFRRLEEDIEVRGFFGWDGDKKRKGAAEEDGEIRAQMGNGMTGGVLFCKSQRV